jgi:hypothetical protein
MVVIWWFFGGFSEDLLSFLLDIWSFLVGSLLGFCVDLVIAPLIYLFWFKRRLVSMVLSILNDDKIAALIRDRFLKGTLGGLLGGRPGSLQNMAKQAAVQYGLPALLRRFGIVLPVQQPEAEIPSA